MGLFSKKESSVQLVSYDCEVRGGNVLYKVTLKNTEAEAVTQHVWLGHKYHTFLKNGFIQWDASVTLNPLETKTFEFEVHPRSLNDKTEFYVKLGRVRKKKE